MMLGLLWIFVVYAVSIVLVHGCYRQDRKKRQKETHVGLITNNSQMQVEWFIRSLLFFSRLKGRDVHITVIDEGSTDETLAIIERLRREYSIKMSNGVEEGWIEEWINDNQDHRMIMVRLGHQEDLVTAFKML